MSEVPHGCDSADLKHPVSGHHILPGRRLDALTALEGNDVVGHGPLGPTLWILAWVAEEPSLT